MSQATLNEKDYLFEVRLNYQGNRLDTGETDEKGKKIYKARSNFVAKIVDVEGGKKKYLFLDRGPVYTPKYGKDGTIYAGKQSFHIKEDGVYKAREADSFDKTELIDHTFTVVNGSIKNGASKKVNSGKDVDGGFSLDHF